MNSGSDVYKPLVSVHYPGVIKDISKMLETLGGIRTISCVYAEKNRRLELRWRPEDSFCKPTYAARRPVVALLLKVKFLATTKDKFIYEKIVPEGIGTDWLNSDAPYFLPPVAFSRMDSVQNFNFSKVPTEEDKANVIGRLRRKRYSCTKCIAFENPEIPLIPKNVPMGGMYLAKIVTSETLELLKTLFKERPIYSKSAIRGISKLPLIQLKCILPCVAYYFVNGPWRSLWVRFGYDPRKNPSSRIYQTLDYRVRSSVTKDEIKNKRSCMGVSFSHKFTNTSGKNTSVITRNPVETNEKEVKSEDLDYLFRPHMIPPSRQCYYQYCDVHVPEVQSMLENLEPIDDSAICHETHGWLPPAMADTCRDIMNKYVEEEVKRRNKLSNQSTNSMLMEDQQSQSSDSESDSTDSENFLGAVISLPRIKPK